MEKPKPTLEQFEEEGVLKPVAETAKQIAFALGAEGYICDVRDYNSARLIILDASNPMTTPTYNTMVEDFTKPGVVISFNEDEQIIRVAPFRN